MMNKEDVIMLILLTDSADVMLDYEELFTFEEQLNFINAYRCTPDKYEEWLLKNCKQIFQKISKQLIQALDNLLSNLLTILEKIVHSIKLINNLSLRQRAPKKLGYFNKQNKDYKWQIIQYIKLTRIQC